MHTLKVFLADDHEGFRRSIVSFLQSRADVEVVGEAGNGWQVVQQAVQLQPDLALVDLHMPTINGFEVARELKKRAPHTKVAILSMHSGDVYRGMAEEVQADAFIEKSSLKRGLENYLSSLRRAAGVSA